MSRKYEVVSKECLAFLFKEADLYDTFHGESWKKLSKDLSKVEFDTENYDLLHFETIGDFTFRWGHAGGDWEYPVHFIIYYDGKDIRGYIPKNGNTWCWTTKQAFGNNTPKEIEFLNKHVLDDKISDDGYTETTDWCEIMEDFDDMRNEIKRRFKIEEKAS